MHGFGKIPGIKVRYLMFSELLKGFLDGALQIIQFELMSLGLQYIIILIIIYNIFEGSSLSSHILPPSLLVPILWKYRGI